MATQGDQLMARKLARKTDSGGGDLNLSSASYHFEPEEDAGAHIPLPPPVQAPLYSAASAPVMGSYREKHFANFNASMSYSGRSGRTLGNSTRSPRNYTPVDQRYLSWTGDRSQVSRERDRYLRPNLDDSAHESLWKSIEKERLQDSIKRETIQMQKLSRLNAFDKRVSSRLKLEVKSGVARPEEQLGRYGLQDTRGYSQPFTRDHESLHLASSSNAQPKLVQREAHRQFELETVRRRRAYGEFLEEIVQTPFSKTRQKALARGLTPAEYTQECKLEKTWSSFPPLKAKPAAEDPGPDEDALKALSELDGAFQDRLDACNKARFNGKKRKENFSLSLDCGGLKSAGFDTPC